MVEISRAEFEDAVAEALDTIPAELAAAMDNVVVMVEEEPEGDDPELLGVYDGVPLTERGDFAPLWPDRILIYRGPLQRFCATTDELVDEIAITVVHEVAHHFGIDDHSLHEWGWG